MIPYDIHVQLELLSYSFNFKPFNRELPLVHLFSQLSRAEISKIQRETREDSFHSIATHISQYVCRPRRHDSIFFPPINQADPRRTNLLQHISVVRGMVRYEVVILVELYRQRKVYGYTTNTHILCVICHGKVRFSVKTEDFTRSTSSAQCAQLSLY